MELKRRLHDSRSRVCFILLFISGNISSAKTLSDNGTGLNLDCNNDMELMFCHFQSQSEQQNCTEYNLTLESKYGVEHCIFQQCDRKCCCSVEMTLVREEIHTGKVWKGNKCVESKNITVTASIKPKAPTIVSVKESYGNFQIMWKTNTKEGSFSNSLTAYVTYHKKGGTETVSKPVPPTTVNGLKYYEILCRDLEPSTTYVVSVKSYTDLSGRFSDSSEEWDFTTPASHRALISAIIICLSIAAVIITIAAFCSYKMFKAKWWDTVAKCPNPKLLDMRPGEQKLLKPLQTSFSTVSIDPAVLNNNKPWSKGSLSDTSSGIPQQSSGISTGPSSLSSANTEPVDIKDGVQDALDKVFSHLRPVTSMTTNLLTESNKDSGLLSTPDNPCGVRADDSNSSPGSTDFDNKTYSINIPSWTHQITTEDEVQTEGPAEMLCDSAYHPSEGDIVICANQQGPACPVVNLPPVVSSLMPTDMSYQQCNANSGSFSYTEDSSLSSISSGANTIASCDPVSRVEAGCESFDEVVGGATMLNGKTEEATICDENPCYVPAHSHSFPPVDDDYQAFQNLVEQPDILFSENRSVEKEENFNKYPEESFTKMPQSFLSPVVPGFINNVHGDQCLSELQRPFLPLISADQSVPVITDNGYQRV